MLMNISGMLIGAGAFIIICILHPVIVLGEYHFGKRIWPIFLVFGIAFLVLSLFIQDDILTGLIGVLGFSLLWGITELFEQEERVKRGWYPSKPITEYDEEKYEESVFSPNKRYTCNEKQFERKRYINKNLD